MSLHDRRRFTFVPRSTGWQIFFYISIVVLMSNLNALVDSVLHPDIPFFDKEHLLVGGLVGIVSMILFGLLLFYVRYLTEALKKIKTLEMILPICAGCKRIRKADADPDKMESWQQIESYISERTETQFSHGICPECSAKFYPA
jgi:cadmium resistance protein CadD (predicted permease)